MDSEQIEVILKMIRDKQNELGNELDLLEEKIMNKNTFISTNFANKPLNSMSKLLDILDELL